MSDNNDMASKRTWIFEADVHGYYIPEKPLTIDNFELKVVTDEEENSRYIALLTIQAQDLGSAERLAQEAFDRIFTALILCTGRGFQYKIKEGNEITFGRQGKREHKGYMTMTFPFVEELKSEMIDKTCVGTKEILGLLQKCDSVSNKAIEYFMIGTKLSRWPREAFLLFFKVVELISDNFLPEYKKRIREKVPDLTEKEIRRLATNRRKILNACEILDIKVDNERIGKIVNVRNRFDIAHATLETAFDEEYLDSCRELARELIVNYMRSL